MTRRTAQLLSALGPLAIVALFVVMGSWAVHTGVSVSAVVRFNAYYLLCLTLPGVIVLKAIFGSRGTWLADLVLGTITGLCLELVAWALFSLAGLQSLLLLWPLIPLALLVNGSIRAKVLERPAKFGSVWVPLASAAVALSLWRRIWMPFTLGYELPPGRQTLYVDLPWHMGLAVEATRSFPLHVPQMIDAGILKYSWFVHAHIGASSLITGIDVPTLVLRLWGAPMIALVVFAVGMLAQHAAGKASAAVLAVVLFGTQGNFGFWKDIIGSSNYLTPLSPTLIYSGAIATYLMILLIDAIRGNLTKWGWGLLALVGVVAAGSKSSTMVVVTAAIFGTFIISLIMRSQRRVLAVLAAAAAGLLIFALALVSGGGESTKLQLFGALTLMRPFRALGGDPAFNEHFADALIHTSGVGTWLLIALLLGTLLKMALAMSWVFVVGIRELRTDLTAWLLGGIVVASWLPFLLMSHNGYSQYYFIFGAMPVAAALFGWAGSLILGAAKQRRTAFGIAFLVAGGLCLALTLVTKPHKLQGAKQWLPFLQSFIWQAVAALMLVIVIAVLGKVLRHRWPWLGGVALGLVVGSMTVPYAVMDPLRPAAAPKQYVVARNLAEGEAALWMREHVGLHDVVATNTACPADGKSCDARRWWISGIAGRRVLVEGWRYTPDGADGRIDDDAVLKLNEAAFATPSAETIQALKTHGVSWLVVEKAGRFPTPDLSAWATVEYRNNLITVYRIN